MAIAGGQSFQNLLTAAQFSQPGVNPWAGGLPGASTGGPGNLTFPLPRQGLAGSPMGSTGTTNYFLNGMPIAGGDIAGQLSAIQSGASTPFNTGLSSVPNATAGLPNYQGMLQWLQQLNSPGIQPEQPIYSGVMPSPTWS